MTENLVLARFKKSLATYEDNAPIQKQMAKNLISMIDSNKPYESILEIGCGSGFLTKECTNQLKYVKYTANDIIKECEKYILKYDNSIKFLCGDFQTLKLEEKYDLIISNAVFQWFKSPTEILKKISDHLSTDGIIALTSFGQKNFYELKEIFNIGIEYPKFKNIIKEETIEVEFKTLKELLTHIKLTGVNAIKNYTLTKGKLKELENKYIERYGKIKLTYNPIYIVIENN